MIRDALVSSACSRATCSAEPASDKNGDFRSVNVPSKALAKLHSNWQAAGWSDILVPSLHKQLMTVSIESFVQVSLTSLTSTGPVPKTEKC